MGKSFKRKGVAQNAKGEQLVFDEHHLDDNILPSAEELGKLKAVDPTLIDFLKETITKEQAHRHSESDRRLEVFDNMQKGERKLNILGVLVYFFLSIVFLTFSYYLFDNDHNVAGGIFGGVTFISLMAVLKDLVKPAPDPNKE